MAEWIARHGGARSCAALWWAFMIVFSGALLGGWVSAVLHRDSRHLFSAVAFTLIAGITIAREWQSATRMREMLLGQDAPARHPAARVHS